MQTPTPGKANTMVSIFQVLAVEINQLHEGILSYERMSEWLRQLSEINSAFQKCCEPFPPEMIV